MPGEVTGAVRQTTIPLINSQPKICFTQASHVNGVGPRCVAPATSSDQGILDTFLDLATVNLCRADLSVYLTKSPATRYSGPQRRSDEADCQDQHTRYPTGIAQG